MGTERNLFYRTVSTPLGPFTLAADESCLVLAEFGECSDNETKLSVKPVQSEKLPVLELGAAEIAKYFAGSLQEFTVPYRLDTTPFRRKVWTELGKIPYGQTISYQTLACRIGNSKACRAVGQANHFNPLSIIVPCHRVIGQDGRLVGYGGGLDKKRWLLDWEQSQIRR